MTWRGLGPITMELGGNSTLIWETSALFRDTTMPAPSFANSTGPLGVTDVPRFRTRRDWRNFALTMKNGLPCGGALFRVGQGA